MYFQKTTQQIALWVNNPTNLTSTPPRHKAKVVFMASRLDKAKAWEEFRKPGFESRKFIPSPRQRSAGRGTGRGAVWPNSTSPRPPGLAFPPTTLIRPAGTFSPNFVGGEGIKASAISCYDGFYKTGCMFCR